MSRSSIPLVDLRDFLSGDAARRQAFVQTLGEGMGRLGFVAVEGHGIPEELLAAAYGAARECFGLPEAEKKKYETPEDGRQRGYTSFGVEHAKDQPVPDLKEFWHVGRSLGADHPLHQSHQVPPNLFPAQVPAFAPTFTDLYARMDGFANHLLEALGAYLGYPDGFFANLIKNGNSILRVIHYPDVVAPVPGAVRAAAHEDINLITVLPVSTRPGLELLTRDGTWMAVHTPPNVMVCDTGDMMALLTGGKMPATTHRVVNPEGGGDGGRLSMPFFLHPRPDAVLAVQDGKEVRADAYLAQRLREIGVM
ncbi:MAG TPA: 2-oxoglutarate and iron-dependent oxygenase domain-containing protein [Myxococcota bacterium]|nr:2-oxoglutarate and iron-dependent oxygenase domain-containing protein [Myxococcota bacterium]HNH46025.1 2-oxoglutarate and iron-dependent oxygenase domain-containing protein [Myxococcota bacterium]